MTNEKIGIHHFCLLFYFPMVTSLLIVLFCSFTKVMCYYINLVYEVLVAAFCIQRLSQIWWWCYFHCFSSMPTTLPEFYSFQSACSMSHVACCMLRNAKLNKAHKLNIVYFKRCSKRHDSILEDSDIVINLRYNLFSHFPDKHKNTNFLVNIGIWRWPKIVVKQKFKQRKM